MVQKNKLRIARPMRCRNTSSTHIHWSPSVFSGTDIEWNCFPTDISEMFDRNVVKFFDLTILASNYTEFPILSYKQSF